MTDKSVTISDAAARRIASILGSSPEKQALRVSVEGGAFFPIFHSPKRWTTA